MDDRDWDGCGEFDYTADECMLPPNHLDPEDEITMANKTRQEEAYDFITGTFMKLLERDNRIASQHKKAVLAAWADMFDHEGVRNNMLMAFSALFEEIDKRMDAARKAGMMQIRDAFDNSLKVPSTDPVKKYILNLIDTQISSEQPEEETIDPSIDLTEVGGGDEDNTPLL